MWMEVDEMDGMKTWMGKQGYMDGVADVDLSWGDGNGWGWGMWHTF